MGKRILIVSDRYGKGDDKLGTVLMGNFLYALAREVNRPVAIMLANSGVRLACDGSDSLDDLRLLAENGVTVRACGTCLDFYGLTERLAVGEVGTMAQTVGAVCGDDAILTIG